MSVQPRTEKLVLNIRHLHAAIRKRCPSWTREMVSQAVALARLGRGPYAAEWARLEGGQKS